jgi:hypothetical protein
VKWFQFFKTSSDGNQEVDIANGNITVSGDFSTAGLAQDATLTDGNQITQITSDTIHTAAVINSQPTGSEYGIVVRPITTNNGIQEVEGIGTPGSQSGGVLTIQGDPTGTPIPVTGSFFVSIPAVGTNNTTAPTSSMEAGIIDTNGNLQGARGTIGAPNSSDLGLIVKTAGISTVTGTVNAIIASGIYVTSGHTTIDNFPTIQPVSGSVSVSNLPITQTISGVVTILNPVSSVSISNFPNVQQVAGTVNAIIASGIYITSGHTTVDNFPAIQTVNGTITASGTGNFMVIGSPGAPPVNVSGSNLAVKITDGTLFNTIKQISNQVTVSDYGIVTNSVIHGLSTGGGGGYVDVKVNPSGALTVDASGNPISISNFPTTQQVSGSVLVSGHVAIDNFPPVQVVSGIVISYVSNTPNWSVWSVPAITNQLLLSGNPKRVGCTIVNNSPSGVLFIKFGSGASPVDWSYYLLPGVITPGGTLEFPQPIYTGIITAAWNFPIGSAMISEATY